MRATGNYLKYQIFPCRILEHIDSRISKYAEFFIGLSSTHLVLLLMLCENTLCARIHIFS